MELDRGKGRVLRDGSADWIGKRVVDDDLEFLGKSFGGVGEVIGDGG